MIIVSQDKKIITNFDNTLGIQIEEHIKNSDGEKDYEIKAMTEKRTCNVGTYDTEERAKEVLQEINLIYSWFETIKITPDSCKVTMLEQLQKNGYEKMSIYEMPED